MLVLSGCEWILSPCHRFSPILI